MDKILTLDEALFWAGSIDQSKCDVYFKIYGKDKIQLIVEDLYVVPYSELAVPTIQLQDKNKFLELINRGYNGN